MTGKRLRLYALDRSTTTSGYDEAFGFVVRAISAREARRLASEQAGDEGADAWLDSKKSTCEILRDRGKVGVIIRDFNAG